MTSITIKDVGKYTTGGTVPSGEVQAPGDAGVAGAELTLKGAQLTFNVSTFIDDTSVAGLKADNNTSTSEFTIGDVGKQGVGYPSWVLNGVAKNSNEDDMKMVGRLIFFTKTKGYKELYAPADATRTDILSYSHYGERESDSESTLTVNKIDVRIKGMTISQSADRKLLKWTLTLVELV